MKAVQLYTTVMPHELLNAFEEVGDQELWVTHLVLCATTQHLEVGNLAMQLTSAEIVRRMGEQASENASVYFTQGHNTHAEMIRFVIEDWAGFLSVIQPEPPSYVKSLQEATQQELCEAVNLLTPSQRNQLRTFLGSGAES
jgi:hypothetical protein